MLCMLGKEQGHTEHTLTVTHNALDWQMPAQVESRRAVEGQAVGTPLAVTLNIALSRSRHCFRSAAEMGAASRGSEEWGWLSHTRTRPESPFLVEGSKTPRPG